MFGMHRNRISGNRAKSGISLQRICQLAAFALFNGYATGFQNGKIFTGSSKSICLPVLNCYSCPGALGACPIGALQMALGSVGSHFPFYVLGLIMLFGIVLGRAICGLLCPFGLVQDLLHKIPTPKLKVPKAIDRPARYLKYILLALAVILLPALVAAKNGYAPPYFCQYICPAGTLGGGIPLLLTNPELRQAAGALFNWKLTVLLIIIAAAILINRPFCRYLCPLGAFYSLFNRFSFYQMQVDKSKCTNCKSCESVCTMTINITQDINSHECIRCGKCKSVCPTGAISSGFYNKSQIAQPTTPNQ